MNTTTKEEHERKFSIETEKAPSAVGVEIKMAMKRES